MAALFPFRILGKVSLGERTEGLGAGARAILLLTLGGIDAVGNVATHRVRVGARGGQSNGRILPDGRASRAAGRSVTKTKCPTLNAVGRDPQSEPSTSQV